MIEFAQQPTHLAIRNHRIPPRFRERCSWPKCQKEGILIVASRGKAIDARHRRVDEVVATLPVEAFRRVVVAEGSQGPLCYEYAEVWVWFSEEGQPGPRERLLVRRSLGQNPEVKYHRSNAPAEQPLKKLAQVRATRWTIEENFESAKGECGLDEYETRGWLGWHHHRVLSMVALMFLVRQKCRWGKKRVAADGAGGAGRAGASVGSARVGRRRDSEVVALAS